VETTTVGCRQLLRLVASSRVGIVVDSSVSSQLVTATEAFGAAWKSTRMRFFPGVSSNMPGLVLESVECLDMVSV
jgi:hypothetical protein